MQVYRVEDEDGGGPYNGNRAVDYDRLFGTFAGTDIWERNPPPKADIPGWYDLRDSDRRKYKFGFDSLDQLYSWFTPRMIDVLGMTQYFKVAKYELPSDADIMRGAHQLAFDKQAAKLVKRDPILPSNQLEMKLITKSSAANNPSTEVDIPF